MKGKILKGMLVFVGLLISGSSLARDVTIAPRSKTICIGQTKKLMQLENQALWWEVDGRSSNMSTWWYNGTNARLTLDVDTANVYAECRRKGRETFDIKWMVAYSDPNVYSIRYTVNCIPCAPETVKMIGKKINSAVLILQDTPMDGDYYLKLKGKSLDMLAQARGMISKLMEDPKFPRHKKKYLEKLSDVIIDIMRLIDVDQIYSEDMKKALKSANKLIKKLK